jgi:hypothetical protein
MSNFVRKKFANSMMNKEGTISKFGTEEAKVNYAEGIRCMRLQGDNNVREIFDDTENSLFLSDEEPE